MRLVSRFAMAAFPIAVLAACNSGNALAPQFQPEVVNTPNVKFSFQATHLQNVSDNLTYNWSVSSGGIIIHPATATTAGTVGLTIRDAAGAVVYDGGIPPAGDITPPAGTAGMWQVQVAFNGYSGTINFRLQMQ